MLSMSIDINQRYFMFSREHYDIIKSIEEKSGNRNYKFGQVYVNGIPKTYTSIERNPEVYSKRYGDAKVIITGNIRKIRHTEPDIG